MYRYYVTKRSPVSLWMLDDTIPFQEYSGFNLSATKKAGSGDPTRSVPLVSGAGYSSVFSSASVGQFACNLFKRGMEDRSFAIEAWLLPIPGTTVGIQQVLSHDGIFDGLTINDKTIRFGTSYATSGDAFCEFDIGEYKLIHAVGIHNYEQNQLFINGELVAQVDLTDAQREDSYLPTTSDLFAGFTSSTQKIAMNAVAFYPGLSGSDIKRNYLAGIDFIGQEQVYPQFQGVSFDLESDIGSVFLQESWVDRDDFERGFRNNVQFSDTKIVPSFNGNTSAAGSWICSAPLDAQGDTSIYGALLSWSGTGVQVSTSLDGIAWTPAKSGELVSTIANGYNPTGKDLQVMVSFAGGIVDDQSYLDSLYITGYRDNKIANVSTRTVSSTHPSVVRSDFQPNLYKDSNGLLLGAGTLTIGPDTSADPDITRTIELWVKPITASASIGGMGASPVTYRNGVTSSTQPLGEWSLIHMVAAANVTGPITVTGNCIIGQITIYPTALTAAQVDFIWKSYTGATAVRVTDSNSISITEGASPAAVYSHDWAIDSAG